MKKYIAPEVEIKKFNVENIMTGSEATVSTSDTAVTGNNGTDTVTYSDLFNL